MRAVAAGLKTATAAVSACTAAFGTCALAEPDVQTGWAATSITDRLRVVRRARQSIAARAEEFAEAISPTLARTKTDTLLAEVLPLLDACKFLEREARHILAPRKLGSTGRPLWFYGVTAEVHREPLGHVLVIGPSNFPLFLPGVQTLQALVAGNTVTWKPGAGGAPVARLLADVLQTSGLPLNVLTITDESIEAAHSSIAARPDKVIFTGSSASGQSVLADLAQTSTPAVVELSGADAIIVTPSANLPDVAKAVAFGLRLNGAAVCMSPRRLFAERTTMTKLRPLLEAELDKIPAIPLNPRTASQVSALLDEAVHAGATLHGEFHAELQRPILVAHATPAMSIARSDFFAPILALIEVPSMLHVPELYAQCPYGLGVSIFCSRPNESRARVFAKLLKAGTVLINDIIAPTADPRVPFGGRGDSGFGVTRGAEGLLEMTAVKTLLVRRGGSLRHLDPTSGYDSKLIAALIGIVHRKGFASRWIALKQLIKSSRH